MKTVVLFAATSPGAGSELWISDGTAAGTVLLTDIIPGARGSGPGQFLSLGNGRVLFVADDGVTGVQPFVTDGTAAGTHELLVTHPATIGNVLLSTPDIQQTALGDGCAIFLADTGVTQSHLRLFVTDGTTAGTTQLLPADVSGTAVYDPRLLSPGHLLFSGTLGGTASALWITDGTAAGTRLVKDINPGGSALVDSITPLGDGRARFEAFDPVNKNALWITDGTAAGTTLLKSNPGPASVGFDPIDITRLANGRIVFAANDGVSGSELWTTDGTAAGTMLLKDLAPGPANSYPAGLTPVADGKAVFTARADANSSYSQLYVTDGSPNGTTPLPLTIDGATADYFVDFTPIAGGKVTFEAATSTSGTLQFVTDGTAAGTFRLDLPVVTGGPATGSFAALPTGETLFYGTSGQPQPPRGTVPPPNQPPAVFLYGTYGSPGDLAIVAPLFTLNPTAVVVTGPDALFDQAFYLGNSPDVVAARVDATAHFQSDGWREGRNPSALFDTVFYLNQNPDVAAAGINPLTHYEQYGWHEGRDPSAGFSTTAYFAANPDVAAAGVDPLQQYVTNGTGEGRAAVPATTHAPAIDIGFYLHQNPDVAAADINPVSQFFTAGFAQGRDPSLLFSVSKYLAANPDVQAAGVDPYLHYLEHGQTEGRATFLSGGAAAADPLIQAAYYDPQLGAAQIPTGPAAEQQAAFSYHHGGWPELLNPDAYFNTAYYLAHNPDVAASGIDPLQHFEQFGWQEGRNPGANFSVSGYLAANPDVKAAGVDPLLHYVTNGAAEGRAIYPA